MTTRARAIPKHATVERLHLATVPPGADAPAELIGRTVAVVLLAGERSHGYRSDYSRVPMRYLIMDTAHGRRLVWSYTGRRYDAADRDYRKAVRDLADWPSAPDPAWRHPNGSLVRVDR